MAKEIKKSSLREDILSAIGEFLYDEGFARCQKTKEGILELINLISDYYEEGVHLFPEVIISNDINELFKTIPNRELVIQESELSVDEFKNAVKLCAPLATDSWTIFIEVNNNRIRFGLATAEMSETSPSLYHQTVGEMGVELSGVTVAYIKNISQKTVELVGLKKKSIVSLTLHNVEQLLSDEVKRLSFRIVKSVNNESESLISSYVEKIINEAIKIGHGNLIGVVDSRDEAIQKLKADLNDGIYLKEPIDLAQLIMIAETEKRNDTSIALKSFSKVIMSMLNHDGITLFTTDGKVIGYHMFIKSYIPDESSFVGGARTRAFESMKYSKLFNCCFYKSQDGNIKYWEENV
jgi:hypothetical protein